MALWDKADLLSRVKRISGVPATTEFPADSDWYAWLTEAQIEDVSLFAAHVPEALYGAPVLLTTGDSGATYSFPANEQPIGRIELRMSRSGPLLVIGPEWDDGADFAIQGNKLLTPGGRTRTFGDGPYARYVSLKDTQQIDASTEPILQPPWARLATVYGAVAKWAERGGMRDPRPFDQKRQAILWGDPNFPGDVGIIGTLKNQYLFQGAAAIPLGTVADWWRSVDDGSGYPTP